ncbi:MAG: NAD(P)H-hydrate epimerase [Chloroflexi bacterium]|nr:NAD(P)H-hydrate epimerase [Chloroflexota bacterium]
MIAHEALPTQDPRLQRLDVDLDMLAGWWSGRSGLAPISAEGMRGADLRAQRLGVTGDSLMEEAGTAVAAVSRAMLGIGPARRTGQVLVLAGPGNNGGDGLVAARLLARDGIRVVVLLAATDDRPTTPDSLRNWDRLDGIEGIERIHAATSREVRLLLNGIERAGLVIDALLGTGVRGALRDPIVAGVQVCIRAHASGVPVLAVDTPTSVDLSSGVPSDPVVQADATITFHRPKTGLLGRDATKLAGRVLVAPIGIPFDADRA